MKNDEIIIREESSYKALLLRKSWRMKMGETLFFIFALLALGLILNSDSTTYKIGAFVAAALVVGLAPFFYRYWLKPVYTLTRKELIIETRNKKMRIPLSKVDTSYDLRHFFLIDGKKTPLMVSDQFISQLTKEIEKRNRRKK
ncbi:hypothetical protein L1765_07175 [Microaerobacter geothermalis]|uniref:hypothetical protein n=1 Tax=Microaerobacter geothermalis TaxID=674972 RepID=UPI001F33F791|nr:hypothetical protein [Microaerobacter geothermalis]MCF6093760.1 hypothetical protein [Microaerobacter geothermalis]